MVAKEFLGPAADDMDLSVVLKDFLNGATITYPIKFGTPEELL